MRQCGEQFADDPLHALAQWYRTPLGQRIAQAEETCLRHLLEESFGYYLLQLGLSEPFAPLLGISRVHHRLVIEAQPTPAHPPALALCGALDRLPFAADSLDVVVMIHALDFASNPHGVLREVERVLVPEGRVILLGFNPHSAWGLRRLWPRWRPRVPWCGSHLTPGRLTDWLALVGMQVERREMLVFCPPVRRAFGTRLENLEALGQRWWPLLGGIYALRAVKRVYTPTPVRPSWPRRRARLLPGGAVKPTVREQSDDSNH